MEGTRRIAAAGALALVAACGEPLTDDTLRGVAVEGPWVVPDETYAIGNEQYVENTQAGPWVGESGCGGSFLAGTRLLQDWILTYFPQVPSIGGYSCRPINGNPNVMSVHATGRAIDVFIPTIDGEADNELGDPLANYLVEHVEELGIQLIIWDRWTWNPSRSPGDKSNPYTGAHPHHDHLHVELSVAAANMEVDWYNGPMDPPSLPACGTIPATGGIVDDADACARAFGPGEFWRVVEGQGYGGRLLWTDAFESSDPSNWARYELHMEAAGRYQVEYYSTAEFAVHDAVDYEVRHGTEVARLSVDQAGLDGWIPLGTFDFAAGGAQSISVLDTAGPVGDGQHIIFDAVRLTPESDIDPGPGPGDLDAGCCSTGGSGSAPSGAIVLAGLVIAALRRRR